MSGIGLMLLGAGPGKLSAVATPNSITSSGPNPAVFGGPSVTAVAGGYLPYTHSWTKTGGGSISAVTPAAASTTFQAAAMAGLENRVATFIDTVTDASGATIASNVVTVNLTRT